MTTYVLLQVLLPILCAAPPANEVPAADKPYVITTDVQPTPLPVNSAGHLSFAIEPKTPWLLKTTTPLKISITASAGLTLSKTELSAQDIVDAKSAAKTLSTQVTGTTVGEHKVSVTYSFFLCTEQICQRFLDKGELTIVIPRSPSP